MWGTSRHFESLTSSFTESTELHSALVLRLSSWRPLLALLFNDLINHRNSRHISTRVRNNITNRKVDNDNFIYQGLWSAFVTNSA